MWRFKGGRKKAGMDYILVDISIILYWHYQELGGRILYFFFEIICIRIGLPFIRVIQSIVITLLAYFSYRAICREYKWEIVAAVIPIILYGIISINIARDGVYWFSASVLSVQLCFLCSICL